MFDGSGTVSPTVRNSVIIGLWVPVLLIVVALGVLFAAVGIGLAVLVVRFALHTSLPSATAVVGAVPTTWLGAVVPVAGAVGYALFRLYLMAANATFGTETVEESLEQAEEVTENAD